MGEIGKLVGCGVVVIALIGGFFYFAKVRGDNQREADKKAAAEKLEAFKKTPAGYKKHLVKSTCRLLTETPGSKQIYIQGDVSNRGDKVIAEAVFTITYMSKEKGPATYKVGPIPAGKVVGFEEKFYVMKGSAPPMFTTKLARIQFAP